MKRIKLALRGETIRVLTAELAHVRGGQINCSRSEWTTASTDGNTGCLSEASGCASICENSCINQSCHVPPGP